MDGLPAALKNQDGGDDPYVALVNLLSTVTDDHAQLRMLVYEFARRKLRRNLHRQFEDGNWVDIQQQIQALESAIDRVEANFAQNALRFDPQPPLNCSPLVPVSDQPRAAEFARKAGGIVSRARTLGSDEDETIASSSEAHASRFDGRAAKRSRSTFWWRAQLGVAVTLGVGIFALVDTEFWPSAFKSHAVSVSSATNKAQDPERRSGAITPAPSLPNVTKPNIPLPTDYGVFALAQGKLTELELLKMRVPDQRVAISPVISTPSRVHLPEGKLEFVVFRRDLANITPDRAMLRVIAQVVRALTFDTGGKPTTANLRDVWVVRGNAYQVRMAPVADNPEMLLIRSDPADFVLPSGRYALVLKGAGYDFTIDGSSADAAHCLERTDALVAPIYSECRTP
jgi:hypothetical protein